MIRTLVAADSSRERTGLSRLLRDALPLEVVGSSALAELRRAVAEFAPDVLVEIRDDGVSPSSLPVVSLVYDAAAAWAARAAAAGAGSDGFAVLPRDADAEEILAAALAVAAGLAVTAPRALPGDVPHVLAELRGPDRLSAREVDVLAELARGAGNKQIAARLAISEHTVKFHVASIFAKLGVSSRTEAVTRGVRLGLIML